MYVRIIFLHTPFVSIEKGTKMALSIKSGTTIVVPVAPLPTALTRDVKEAREARVKFCRIPQNETKHMLRLMAINRKDFRATASAVMSLIALVWLRLKNDC